MARRWYCYFVDRTTQLDKPSTTLSFAPQRWSKMKIGGCDTAEIAVTGPIESLQDVLRLLGDRVRIINEEGAVVWWGYVDEVEVSYGAVTDMVSLEPVANRIAVIYTDNRPDGSSERHTTDWAEDAQSIAKYGRKELRPSFEGTQEEAEAFRARELSRLAWPVPIRRSQPAGPESSGRGMLFCKGFWHRLGWQYWQNLAGKEEYDQDGLGEQTIGASYTATTISFGAQDDIFDSASGLGGLREGDKITVTGAASGNNNGEFTVKTEGAAAIETVDQNRVTAAAGPSITISINGTRVDRIAQSFSLTNNAGSWTVASISVRAMKVGSPTGVITLELCSDSGGNPGTVLDTADVLGDSLSDVMAWTEWPLTNTVTLNFGTTYWIVVRKPITNLANYYIVDVNEDASYANGIVKVHNGTSWSVRDPAADMPFRAIGKTGTLGQVRAIVEANAEFGGGSVNIVDTSNIQTEQFRDGDGLASDEANDLIAIGRSNGNALQVDVLESRFVVIYESPSESDTHYFSPRSGGLRLQSGGPLPPGETVAGVWVVAEDLPILDIFQPATALFVAQSEYDALTDKLNFETDGALSAWRGTRIQRK